MEQRSDRDAGFALAAAVLGVAVFGYVAFAMLAAERGDLAVASGFQTRARLAAAADAGLVAAAAHVAGRGTGERWHIDSRPYAMQFGDVALTIRIEDERGKIRLNQLSEDQVTLMFESVGVKGRRLDELRDAFLDWVDSDDQPRLHGAEDAVYASRGTIPRNGELRSVGEVMRIAGMDRQTYDRIAPAATVFFGGGAFSVSTGQPLAIAVMTGAGMGSPQVIERQRELAGQRSALVAAEDANLAARPLTVRILARDGNGGQLERATIIEFPSGRAGGWVIRYRE